MCADEKYCCQGCLIVMTRKEYGQHICTRTHAYKVEPINIAYEDNLDVMRYNDI
jgi:hypothetical protein